MTAERRPVEGDSLPWVIRHQPPSAIHHPDNDFGLRELRVSRNVIRVFYAFDTKSDAWLLIGGSKKGRKRFYDQMVTTARRLFHEYTGTEDEEPDEEDD